MSTSAVEMQMPDAIGVDVAGNVLRVELSDGRAISVPADWYPRLAHATEKERANWRIIGRGQGIHWEDIDEDISVQSLLAGNSSGESEASLMKWLKSTSRPTFRPWVGKDYGKESRFGMPARLLILGESHYGDTRRDLTEKVIRDYIEGTGYPFFTKIIRTILGPEVDAYERREQFFDAIAFYNYVQSSVGDTHDTPPTDEMWKDAVDPFLRCLDDLRPTHIVAGGYRLWDHMPAHENIWMLPSIDLIGWFEGVSFPSREPKDTLGCYRHSEGHSVVLATHHPSWIRYQPSVWHPVVKRFLDWR